MAEEKLNDIKQKILGDSHEIYKDYQLFFINMFGEEEIFGLIMTRGELTENHPCFKVSMYNHIYKKLVENPDKEYVIRWITSPGMRYISEDELVKKIYV